MFHLVEVRDSGEDEHHGQGKTSRTLPGGKRLHAQSSYLPEHQLSCEQDNQDRHRRKLDAARWKTTSRQ